MLVQQGGGGKDEARKHFSSRRGHKNCGASSKICKKLAGDRRGRKRENSTAPGRVHAKTGGLYLETKRLKTRKWRAPTGGSRRRRSLEKHQLPIHREILGLIPETGHARRNKALEKRGETTYVTRSFSEGTKLTRKGHQIRGPSSIPTRYDHGSRQEKRKPNASTDRGALADRTLGLTNQRAEKQNRKKRDLGRRPRNKTTRTANVFRETRRRENRKGEPKK